MQIFFLFYADGVFQKDRKASGILKSDGNLNEIEKRFLVIFV